MKTLQSNHRSNHWQIAEEEFTSKYIQLTVESVKGRKQLEYNLAVFRRVSENLILTANDLEFLFTQLELARADTRFLKLKLNDLAQRLGLEPLTEKIGKG